MDERQQHLVAAAEAMRTWIHKQRATWAEGYPQSLRHAQPQFAAASAAVVSRSASIMSAAAPAVAAPWTETDSGGSWWQGVVDRFRSTLQGTTTFVQTSWKMLTGIAVIVMLAA